MNGYAPGAPGSTEAELSLTAAAPADGREEESPCWSRTGIYGDRTCSRLAAVAHCRDCPVFTDAVPRLLDRPLHAAYINEWTLHYAKSKRVAAGTNGSAVVFRLGSEWFGLPTQVVREVTEPRRIHAIPHRKPGVLLGLANIRGELLICVSLGHLLTVTGGAGPEKLRAGVGRLVVLHLGRDRYVFPSEEVHGVLRFHSAELRQPPASSLRPASGRTHGVLGWSGRNVGMLNAEALFSALAASLA